MKKVKTDEPLKRPAFVRPDKRLLPSKTISEANTKRGSLVEVANAAEKFARAARSNATKRAYASDFRDFSNWCDANRLRCLPAESLTVALYITALAERGRKVATISRRLISIGSVHRKEGHDNPCDKSQKVVRETMQGIRRTLGTHQRGKSAMTLELLRKVLASLDPNLRGLRDRAILLTGFAGGMRRSELASIRTENLWRHDHGITIFLPSSKTDQEGKGREVDLIRGSQSNRTPISKLTCPVRSLELWLSAAEIKSGSVFRHVTVASVVCGGLSGHSIGSIIKCAFRRAGFKAAELERFSAHSLRAGFATEAYRNGAKELDILRQTGHSSIEMLSRYLRSEQGQRIAAARKLRL